MSAAQETIKAGKLVKPKSVPIVNRFLNFISSVRFGVSLLCILVAFSMIGMLIVQQNVQPGFDTYYASLTPAEKLVFGYLGFFDIYHSWYFNLLLLILSLNIVLASIDRFPSAWSYIVKPKLHASKKWLFGQKQSETISLEGESEERAAERIKKVFQNNGLKSQITRSKGVLYVFGESGKWNRIGAYIVHVFLLTLFLGHFVANQTGFDADVRMMPGETTDQIQLIQFNLDKKEKFNVQLPFSIECTDIQQKLIDPKGSIDIQNTMDWRTHIRIDDPEYGETVADVSLNNPFSYRGYRFFQASAITMGSARTMTLELTPQAEGAKPFTVNLERNGAANLPDGTKVEFEAFLPDFTFNDEGKPDTRSDDYNNPVALLNATPPAGEKTRVFAFAGNVADKIPVGAPKAGYKWRLAAFEKSPLAHVLSIKYDPFSGAFIAWYIGGFGLIGALMLVFFISHKRMWAMVEKHRGDSYEVVLGGGANRNHQAFEDKFKKIVDNLRSAI